MRAAIKDMQRDVSTSIGRLRAVLQFLVLTAPFSISFWMLTTDDMRQKWRDKLPTQSAEVIGALDMLLLHLKRRTGLGGFGTRFGLVTALALAWCAFAVTAIALWAARSSLRRFSNSASSAMGRMSLNAMAPW